MLKPRKSGELILLFEVQILGRAIMKGQIPVLVYGHVPDDLATEYWDIRGWTWHHVLIDGPIAPLVRFLNINGVRTLASCCGHERERGYVSIAEWSVAKAESLGYAVAAAPDGWAWAVREGHEEDQDRS